MVDEFLVSVGLGSVYIPLCALLLREGVSLRSVFTDFATLPGERILSI